MLNTDAVGDAVAVPLHEIAVEVVVELVVAERPLHAGLEAVGAGDVRARCREHELLRIDARGRRHEAFPLTRSVHVACRSQASMCRSGVPLRRAALLLHAGLIADVEVLDVGRVAAFEQQRGVTVEVHFAWPV